MKTIQIKDGKGGVLFTHTCEGNNIRLTLEVAIKSGANLSGAGDDWVTDKARAALAPIGEPQ